MDNIIKRLILEILEEYLMDILESNFERRQQARDPESVIHDKYDYLCTKNTRLHKQLTKVSKLLSDLPKNWEEELRLEKDINIKLPRRRKK